MMSYEERKALRENILNEVFEQSNPIDEMVRNNWQITNRLPSVKENRAACNKLCKIAQKVVKAAFINQDSLYERFCRECEEITERFQCLNAKTAIEAACGVSQVGYYLYDECFDLTAEALGIFVQRQEEWDY